MGQLSVYHFIYRLFSQYTIRIHTKLEFIFHSKMWQVNTEVAVIITLLLAEDI